MSKIFSTAETMKTTPSSIFRAMGSMALALFMGQKYKKRTSLDMRFSFDYFGNHFTLSQRIVPVPRSPKLKFQPLL